MSDGISRETMLALREHFVLRQHELLALTCALVEAESPSGDREGSIAVVSLIASAAASISSVNSVERFASEDFGEHIAVRAFGKNDDSPGILILGHTDTVHPRGAIKDRPWRTEANRIYGPGIFDMKVNCALALEALRACEGVGVLPQSAVTILLTCDEETGSPSGRPLVEAEAKKSRAALVIELAKQTIRLHELNDPDLGTTVTVNVVQGGTHSNVIPAEARAEVDMRFTSADSGAKTERRILSLTPFDPGAQVVITGGINRPPLERTQNIESLYSHARALAS